MNVEIGLRLHNSFSGNTYIGISLQCNVYRPSNPFQILYNGGGGGGGLRAPQGHHLLAVEGTLLGRLDRKQSTLYTLCLFPSNNSVHPLHVEEGFLNFEPPCKAFLSKQDNTFLL